MSSQASSVERFERFASLLGFALAPHQRRIAEAIFSPAREVVVVVPRGAGKTRLVACICLFHLLDHPEPQAYVGAASRDQARVCFEYARTLARHPAVARRAKVRHNELRTPTGHLRVLASDGGLAHGLTASLAVADELWAHKSPDLLEAFQTGLVKRPDSKLVVITTAAASLDSPLGRMRTRALEQADVKREGVVTEAIGPDLHLLEWSLLPSEDFEDMALVKACNPAPWIDKAALARQRQSVPEPTFRQFHCCTFGVGEGAWLAPGLWSACRGNYEVAAGEEVIIALDVGGSRSMSAAVAVTADLRVAAVRVAEGSESVMAITDAVRDLAGRFTVREVAYDPWSFRTEALRLEQETGLVMVEFPQTPSRLSAAAGTLHSAIAEGRLRHPGDALLDRHVAQAVAKETERGWRLVKASRDAPIDALTALTMAVARADAPAAQVELLGWL